MRKSKSNEQHRVFAEHVKAGKSLKDSMLAAGYSVHVANRGVAAISKPMRAALIANGGAKELIELSKSLSADDTRHLIFGRLAQNTIEGKDGGVMSAKVWGSQKDLALFTPETQVGVVVVNSPKEVPKTLLDE